MLLAVELSRRDGGSEGLDAVIGDRDGDARARPTQNDGRSVIGTAFDLLDHVGALEPVRLIDLAEVTGIPRPTVHRLLTQLIEVGAVRREGTRYRLGASLLGLGARVAPEHRLRIAARRPMVELAAATGAAVSLSATIGGEAVFLDIVDARVPFRFLPEPGARVPQGSAPARAHTEIGRPTPIVDAAALLPDGSCVAVAIPLGSGEVAAVSACGVRPSAALMAVTQATGARIVGRLRAPSAREATIPQGTSTQ
jgi:DNA-binding IclR family transcriptional regulator